MDAGDARFNDKYVYIHKKNMKSSKKSTYKWWVKEVSTIYLSIKITQPNQTRGSLRIKTHNQQNSRQINHMTLTVST